MSKLTPILVHAEAELAAHVETKVKAASATAALTGGLIGTITDVFGPNNPPQWFAPFAGFVLTGGLTALAGWMAKHTPKPYAPPHLALTPAKLNVRQAAEIVDRWRAAQGQRPSVTVLPFAGFSLYWQRADGQLMCGNIVAPTWLLDDDGRLPDGTRPAIEKPPDIVG